MLGIYRREKTINNNSQCFFSAGICGSPPCDQCATDSGGHLTAM